MNRLTILMFLAACGSQPSTDPTFQPYLDQFNGYMSESNVTGYSERPIVFGDVPNERVQANCHNHRVIHVSQAYWKNMTDDARLVLVMHEQGHCAFGLSHGTGIMSVDVPQHLDANLIRDFINQVKDAQ